MMILRQFIKLTLTELKLFTREPEALFFNFIFPTFMLFVIMEVFVPADAPKEIVVNQVVPPLMVLIITQTALLGMPPTIVSYRTIKFLKRLHGSPITPLTTLGSIVLANFIVTILGIVLLTAVAILHYDAVFDGSFLHFITGFVLVFLSLAAIFMFVAAVARSQRAASAIAMMVFFPIMFFSGVFVPLDMLPDWVRHYISPYIPVTYAVELMQELWLGTLLFDLTQEVFILLGILGIGLLITAYTFKWE
ncbi:MAG: ABC transporter permease [Methanobacteriaceae archaeon]|jgi:ABC-2 type transport system permease protein